jgi:hypothetical protein
MLVVTEIIKSIRRRQDQGDCPTEPPVGREQLENALISLADEFEAVKVENEARKMLTKEKLESCAELSGMVADLKRQLDKADTEVGFPLPLKEA